MLERQQRQLQQQRLSTGLVDSFQERTDAEAAAVTRGEGSHVPDHQHACARREVRDRALGEVGPVGDEGGARAAGRGDSTGHLEGLNLG